MHEDLIFDAPGGVGCKTDVPVQPIGADGLNEADGADGDQVLQVHSGVFKAPGDKHHQPQIVLDEQLSCIIVSQGKAFQGLLLLRAF